MHTPGDMGLENEERKRTGMAHEDGAMLDEEAACLGLTSLEDATLAGVALVNEK